MAGVFRSETITIADIVTQTLDVAGVGVLRDSQRFVLLARQAAGSVPSQDVDVFLRYCDANVLMPFANATAVANPGVQDLQTAAVEAADLLQREHGLDVGLSQRIAGQVMAGTARHLGMVARNNTQAPAPNPVPAPTPAVTAAPASVPEAAPGPAVAPMAASAPPSGQAQSKKPLIIGASALVVSLVLIVVFVVVPRFRTSIYLYDYYQSKSSDTRVEGWKFGTITLPEPFVEHENSEFVGWMPSDEDDKEKIVEAGTEVSPEEFTSYRAVWKPLVSFDGNGADSGKMEPVPAETDGNYKLPESKFKKKGYVFAGWSTKKDETSGSAPGSEQYVGEPTTYYAIWKRQLEIPRISITSLDTSTGEVEGWDESMGAVAFWLINDTGKEVSLKTEIALRNDKNNKLEESTDFVSCMAPGESTLVTMPCNEPKKATKAGYSVEVSETGSYYTPASGWLKQEVLSQEKDLITLQLTNTGDKEVQVQNTVCIVKDKSGAQYVLNPYYYAGLKPGESGEVVFKSTNSIVHGLDIPDLRKAECAYYTNGYASKL